MIDLPRIPMPTDATSEEIARLPASIRRSALFSARLTQIDPIISIGKSIAAILDGNKSASESRRDMRRALQESGYVAPEGKDGSLLDHRSTARLDLILTQNVRKARGYAKRAADMDPDALEQYPAQELVRVMDRKSERNWKARWVAAGGELVQGRMVALKTAPIWANISKFGEPYPPFDYGSGMGLRDIDRAEAITLGLMAENDVQTPEEPEFDDVAQANLPGVDQMPDLQAAIKKAMGDTASFDGNILSLSKDLISGATGSAATLGLNPLVSSAINVTPAQIKPREALSMIKSGQASVLDQSGSVIRFNNKVLDHWQEQKKNPGDVRSRLSGLRQAMETIREPQETWERKGRTFYLRSTEAKGKRTNTVVIAKDGIVETWINASRDKAVEDQRKGTLSR